LYSNKLISIVIALRNEEKYIAGCINSFKKQSISKDLFEIIVVDGQSSDNSLIEIQKIINEEKELKITLLENSNRIQASGWNIGFKYSKAKFVVMMGAHTVVESDFLEMNLKLHKENDVPATGGIVQAKGDNEISRAIALAFNSPFGAGNAKYWYGTKETKVETVAYGMYKRKIFEEIGYIDEQIVRGQDWELNYRISKSYGKFLFSPLIKSFYYARSNYKKLWKRQFGAGFWKIFIIKKHPDSILIRHAVPAVFSFTFITLFIFMLCGVWVPFLLLNISYWSIGIFSAWSVLKEINDKLLIKVTISYFIMHFGYGLGVIWGIIKSFLPLKKHVNSG
jgi:glycosyltransferase involved in cell wall biosynthesis